MLRGYSLHDMRLWCQAKICSCGDQGDQLQLSGDILVGMQLKSILGRCDTVEQAGLG